MDFHDFEPTLANFFTSQRNRRALNLEAKKLWWKDNGKNKKKRRYLAFWDPSYNNYYCYYHCLLPIIFLV